MAAHLQDRGHHADVCGVKAGEPDTQMPIRASAIRGQLRYWWRFLATNPALLISGEDLFNAERDIWGGMAEPDKDYNSKVSTCQF